MSLPLLQSDRRVDPRVDGAFSMANWLQWCSNRLHARALVVADASGRVLAEYGAGSAASLLARIPVKDPVYHPRQVESALFDESLYIQRLNGNPTTKIWPFRFTRGVGYLICIMEHTIEVVHAECEEVCAGFRRIQQEG